MLFYCSQPYYPEVSSLIEHGITLVSRNPGIHPSPPSIAVRLQVCVGPCPSFYRGSGDFSSNLCNHMTSASELMVPKPSVSVIERRSIKAEMARWVRVLV